MAEATEAVARPLLRRESVMSRPERLIDHITALKPRETVLLVYIGMCAALIGGKSSVPWDVLLLVIASLSLGSAGQEQTSY